MCCTESCIMQAGKHRHTHREEVHYRMLSSGLWLAAKHTLLRVQRTHTQLRAYRFFQPPPPPPPPRVTLSRSVTSVVQLWTRHDWGRAEQQQSNTVVRFSLPFLSLFFFCLFKRDRMWTGVLEKYVLLWR